MATPVVMPKLGNTVESSIIVEWRKKVGDPIVEGEPLCDVETDKATVEVSSPASGTLLAVFFDRGADVPVMTTIAAIGAPGEDVSAFGPSGAADSEQSTVNGEQSGATASIETKSTPVEAADAEPAQFVGVSPRARNLAARKIWMSAGWKAAGPADELSSAMCRRRWQAGPRPALWPRPSWPRVVMLCLSAAVGRAGGSCPRTSSRLLIRHRPRRL